MRRIIISLLLTAASTPFSLAGVITGRITSAADRQPLDGAIVALQGRSLPAVTDSAGRFFIDGVARGTHRLTVSYITFRTETLSVRVAADTARVDVALRPGGQTSLRGATVKGRARVTTEAAVTTRQQRSAVVQSGVSAARIAQTQDKDAAEVMRRIPGISIIDGKFVMVRGLAQRYNNVWLNGAGVPSSEADTRAFSFDLIPSSQLDNVLIVKSPAPEYPADFTGGFILINTKDVPEANTTAATVSWQLNDRSSFRTFAHGRGSGTDFLGFDGGLRSLRGGIDRRMTLLPSGGIDLLRNHLNNDWRVRHRTPWGDLGLGANLARRWQLPQGETLALLGTANYSNSFTTHRHMQNALFGAYDRANDRPNYLRHSVDDQWSHNVRWGAMLNLTFEPATKSYRLELKNVLNQLATDRYTHRRGLNAQSNNEESAEYYYSSRTIYNAQLTGRHTLTPADRLEWSAGYAYANRNLPDRRRYTLDDGLSPGRVALANANDLSREFTRLDEHMESARVNNEWTFSLAGLKPLLRAGAYAEYRTRHYRTRDFIYNYNAAANDLPAGFRYLDLPTELLQDANYGERGLYLMENVKWSNNYDGHNTLAAGYAGLNVPAGRLNAYAGLRFEWNRMELVSHSKDYERSPYSTFYTAGDFFPSLNLTYRLDERARRQVRLCYGRTINRPEFREVSPSVYYDFDLASNVQGNYALRNAYIDNLDVRFEFYPARGEQLSLALFYKHFDRPIEWTYTVNGGTDLTYSFRNARGADNYGLELDVQKSLDFIGLKGLSWNFNGSLIKSRVRFPSGSKEKNRPMQGQSPYLVNTGLFYRHERGGWQAAVLYNRIGKRIVGVGRSAGQASDNVRIPDSYEMPRNSIDLSASKRFGGHLEVKASLRDVLAEHVEFKQFEHTDKGKLEEVVRSYRPGRNLQLSATWKF